MLLLLCHTATSPECGLCIGRRMSPGGFHKGFIVFLHPGNAEGMLGKVRRCAQGRVGYSQGRKTGTWALPLVFSCPHHPTPSFALADPGFIPSAGHSLCGTRAESPATGAWAEPPLWSLLGVGCPLWLPSPATASEQNEKILDLFSEREKNPRKIQYSVCDPRLRAWLWQENAVNLPFPHQRRKKD